MSNVTEINCQKGLLLMLAAHEPTLDPRLDWEARSASKEYDVRILGLHNSMHSLKKDEEVIDNSYIIHRFIKMDNVDHTRVIQLVMKAFLAGSPLLLIFMSLILVLIDVFFIFPLRLSKFLLSNTWCLKAFFTLSKNKLISTPFFKIKIVNTIHRLIDIKCNLYWYMRHFIGYEDVIKLFIHDLPRAPKVIHANDLDTLLAGVLLKKTFPEARLIYDAHESYPYSDPNSSWFQRNLFFSIEKMLITHCDEVITVSDPLAQHMERTYTLTKPVIVVPNAEPYTSPKTTIATTNSLDVLAQGRLKVLFQGNFASQRGLEEILKEWKNVDSYNAALFLRGPDNSEKDKLVKKIENMGLLNKSIYFVPPVTESNLVDAASQSDLGLIPYKPIIINYKYCCPNKLSQYFQAGIGVITNDLPYVKSILEPTGAGLSYNSNITGSFSSLINRLAKNREAVDNLKKNARRAAEVFNWQAFEGRLLAAYNG